MEIDETLLEEIDNELRKDDIAHRARPWRAIAAISKKMGVSIVIPSEEASYIFKWFEKNGKPGSQQLGHYHQGAFYFDSEFWSVSIPLVYGEVTLNSLDALHKMPDRIKSILKSDSQELCKYVVFWADCIDFGYAYGDLIQSKSHGVFGIQLLHAGYEELSSATSLLLEKRPNGRAILNCRMATEMLLKSFIYLKQGLSESEAKRLGHDLKALLNRFIECSGYANLKVLEPLLKIFPEIGARYSEQTSESAQLFEAYCFAQSIGALLARAFTDRNTLPQVLPSNKSNNSAPSAPDAASRAGF